jgi:hypothetical protein
VFLDQEGLPTAVTIVAHNHPFVIGVDTHARNHALAILAATGQQIDSAEFPTTKAGMARAIAWVARRTGGDLAALWVIECAATYGAQFAHAVAEAGYQVLEAPRMNAGAHRGVGTPTRWTPAGSPRPPCPWRKTNCGTRAMAAVNAPHCGSCWPPETT